MGSIVRNASIFVIGVAAGSLIVPSLGAEVRVTKSTRLMTTDLAGWCDGKEVTVELNEPAPGTSGRHYHPGHSYTYILEGSELYSVEGQAPRMVRAGEVLHEGPMQIHTAENRVPAKLLVIRVVEKGKAATVRLP
jgi:hypothetical protein